MKLFNNKRSLNNTSDSTHVSTSKLIKKDGTTITKILKNGECRKKKNGAP